MFSQIFSPCDVSSNSFDIIFLRTEIFSFNIVQFISSFFHRLFIGGVIKKKKVSPQPRSSSFYLMLSSRSCIAFYFAFRSTLHCELLFLIGIQIHIFVCGCPVVTAQFVKDTLFAPLCFLCPFVKVSGLHLWGLLLDCILFHLSIFVFFC